MSKLSFKALRSTAEEKATPEPEPESDLQSVTAEISPARVVYPDNWYKQIFSCYLFLILCFLGLSVEGVRNAVHRPGP